MISALIFDLDGLLVDSESLAASAMDEFLAGFGHDRRPEVHQQLLGRRLPDAIAIVKNAYGLDRPLDELVRTYGDLRLAALRGRLRPMPGAFEIIALGRKLGLRLALATSGLRAHAQVSLAETGLASLFDAEVTGDEVEHGKPAPDLFLAAASKLQIPPAQCVVFEDAPNGVVAAVAAGMRVVAVPNASSRSLPFPVAPSVVVTNLHDAAAWVQREVSAPTQDAACPPGGV